VIAISVFSFERIYVPRAHNITFIHIFNALAALQWKATVSTTKNKVLCEWLSIGVL
jgi:hypothetical protein